MIRWIRRAIRSAEEGNLHDRVIAGGSWAFSLNIANRTVTILKLIILANLLAPVEFGLFGIGVLVLSTLSQLSQLGLDRALIQRREGNIDEFLDTVWVLRIARGVILFGVGFIAAPLIADWFGESGATNLIRVLVITALIVGVENPATTYFEKDLQFHRKFALKFPGTLISMIVAIAFATIYGSVWALVAGRIAGDLIRTISSYLLHPYRPRPDFDKQRAVELVNFGKWIAGSSILTYAITTADDVFVGWFFGASPLGLYQMAFRLSNAPATEITHTLQSVLRPTFSKLQTEEARLRQAMIQAAETVFIFVFPMGIGIFLVTEPFIRLVLGIQWVPMADAMKAFALIALLRASLSITGPLYEAIGRPDILTKTQAIGSVGMLASLYPLSIHYGILGTAAATGVRFVFAGPIALYYLFTHTELTPQDFAHPLLYPLGASTLMAICVTTAQYLMVGMPLVVIFGTSIFVGVTTYLITIQQVDKRTEYKGGSRIKNTLRSRLR